MLFTWAAVVAVTMIRTGAVPAGTRPFLESWARWDSGFYLQISEHGYTQLPQTPFFPFYPLLIRAFGGLVSLAHHTAVPEFWGGVLASASSSLVAFVAIAALANRELHSSDDAWRTLVLIAAYPFSFFLATVYPQATFLAFATLTLLFARSGRWLAAAGFAYLTALTHQTAMALVLPLGWEYVRHQRGLQLAIGGGVVWSAAIPLRVARGLLLIGAAPLGVLTYVAYLWRSWGDPFLIQKVEAGLWGRHLTPPWRTAAVYWEHLHRAHAWSDVQMMMLLEGSVWLGFAVLSVVLARRQPFMFTLYVAGLLLLCIALPTTSDYFPNPITGTGRYLIGATPIFIGVAAAVRNHRAILTSLVGSGVVLQAILAAYFFANGFVA